MNTYHPVTSMCEWKNCNGQHFAWWTLFQFVFSCRDDFLKLQWCGRPLCSGETEALQRPASPGRELPHSIFLFQACRSCMPISAVLSFAPHHWLLSTLPASSCQSCSAFCRSLHRSPCHHQETQICFGSKGLCNTPLHPPKYIFFFFVS